MPKPKHLPGVKIDEIIRVDHAGEFGAIRIYQGQLKFAKSEKAKSDIRHMLEQEYEHFNFFSDAIIKNKVRPTVLFPLWRVGAYFMGAATSILGEKAAMTCTIAVEDVIDQHYLEQIESIQNVDEFAPLRSRIIKFREEELEHKKISEQYSPKSMKTYNVLYKCISLITKTAIKLSKKF